MMTGPGTNSYLVGGGAAQRVGGDRPRPGDAAHVQAMIAAAPGPIRWIFVDPYPQRPFAGRRRAEGAHRRAGTAASPTIREWQDARFVPDVVLARRRALRARRGDTTLRAIHTPGHASNHLCYLLEEEKTLFTGDHVMQGSTVVINPPDGDMAAYLRRCARCRERDLDWIAPGHGFLMAEPRRAIERSSRTG